jgi:hypothetical protein
LSPPQRGEAPSQRRRLKAIPRRLIYRNGAILDELYSFAAIWNPFKRWFFLLHRDALFNIDRHTRGADLMIATLPGGNT